MIATKRPFESIKLFINVKFKLPEHKGNLDDTGSISLYLNQTLNEQFKSFLLKNNIKLKKREYYFYLIKGKDILKSLPKNQTIKNLNLQTNDIILVSYENIQIKPQLEPPVPYKVNPEENPDSQRELDKKNPIIYSKEESKEINDFQNKTKKKIIFILIIILFLLALTGLIILFLYFNRGHEENIPPIFNKDKLVVEKKYPINMILRYSNKRETEMKLEGEKVPKKDSSQPLWMTSDFIFIVRDEKVEKDEVKLTEKNLYTGYIALLNLTSHNKTDEMMIIYDKTLNKLLNNNKLRSLDEPDLKYIGEDGNFCLAKIEFYLNGDIKNYYLSKGMSSTEFSLIEEISKLIIPKISSNLYIKSIDQYFEDLTKNEKENNISEFEIKRILDSNKKKIVKKRILNNESENITNYNVDDEEVEIEEYKTTPLIPSFNYDLREANKINESSDENNNDKIEGNYSNLTQYSLKNAECEDAKMEGSTVNTTTYSIINDKGLLESVEQKIISVMETQKMGNGNDRETDLLYSSVYDNNNQISFIDNDEINNVPNQNQDIDFGISSLITINYQIINLSNYFINEDINKKLYSYFDNFYYEKYNGSDDNSKIENMEESGKENKKEGNNKRNLEQENTYYGMKKMTQVKQLYKYNFIGIKMEKQLYIENDPSTGIASIYAISINGNKNTKIKTGDSYSNLHIIIDKKNQMGYNLITLLNQTNYELIKRNKKYADVIIELEKNMSNLVEEYFDYSNVFKNDINNMYHQVKTFTGEFFDELIELIIQVYDNFITILNNSKQGKYEVMNNILKVIEEEYINYIYNMLDNLEIFQNNTLIFLENVQKEILKINDFQIDLLYDLVDQINNSKIILKNFNKNLFNAIEKGIITFRYDIREYIDNIIGDLLYLTDFLCVNINQNEILIQAIDENKRERISIKLKNFRMANINKNYEDKMSIDNKNSIKNYSYEKVNKYVYNLEAESDIAIKNIKKKIKNIELYELYDNNIDIINNINNKTIFEYINNIHNIINSSLNIKPEYSDKESHIVKNMKSLFNISNKIIFEINEEINEVNNYISNYTKNYIDENIYRIYYNLYYLKQNFENDKMNDLLNEFNLSIKTTISSHLKNLMLNNFDLCFTYLNEAIQNNKKNYRSCTYICSGLIKKIQMFKQKYDQFYFIISSEQFLNIIEKYFYELRNDILNYTQDKILSINKYYFNKEIYDNIFYLIEQSNKEVLNLIDNINNYFNELKLNNELKINALNLIEEILSPINKKNKDNIDQLYKYLYDHLKESCKTKGCDNNDLYYEWWIMPIFGTDYELIDCPHTNNINLVKQNLIETDLFLKNQKNIILNNFKKKIENYLNHYHSYCQDLYNNLYQYVENKLNNKKEINNLLEYQDIFNIVIRNDINDGILQRLNNEKKFIDNNIYNYITSFENNIKLIENNYFNLNYSKDLKQFLEYPKEMIYKIKQFNEELLQNSDNIKNIIDLIFKKRINNIIKSTNNYINNNNKFNFEYIILNINSKSIFEEYFQDKYNKLKITFDEFFIDSNNYYNITNNNSNINDSDYYLFSNLEKYRIIIDNYTNFSNYFENFTNDEFVPLKVEDYSKYNFNIIKLRKGIYYTKRLLENIENLFEEINYNSLINVDKIIYYDKILNNKNIIYLYNKTNYKISQINIEILSYLDEPFDYFFSNLKTKFSYKMDYLPFIQQFKEIIALENDNYNNNITHIFNGTIKNIFSILEAIDDILLSQLSLKTKYDYYNINETYFKEMHIYYSSLLINIFNEYKNKINFLNNSHLFHNSIRKILDELQFDKRQYFKNIANEFSNNYDFHFFNISYDIGENVRLFMEKEYNDIKFNYVYDYVELFENYTDSYIKRIISNITKMEKDITDKFDNIYNKFLNNYKDNISIFINNDFVNELNNNFTLCLDYSYDLLKEKKNIDRYNNLIALINSTYLYCQKNYENHNIPLNGKIEFLKKNYDNCINNLSNLNYTKDSKIIILLNCYKNNFYDYSAFYFDNFSETNKNNLDENFKLILEIIKNNFIDDNFIIKFLEEQKYELQPYKNVSLSDLSYSFEEIEGFIDYYKNNKRNEYKNYLFDMLLESFNISYHDLFLNFVLDELIDNITIKINSKLELNFEYINEKISDEYHYYLLLLNDTEELGNSTKTAFKNLYNNIKTKLKESFNYHFIDEIHYYLNSFFRENKKTFINNFINYYLGDINKYINIGYLNLNIFNIKELIDEIILNKDFNKTIEKISDNLINHIIIEPIKENINDAINKKIINIYNICDEFKNNISEILENINTKELPEDMTFLNKLVLNYMILVENQNNYFTFIISDKPFNHLNNFIKENLEPPLLLIKNKYNTIEETLLNEIIKIVSGFPDYFSIIKSKLNLDSIKDKINLISHEINKIFIEYKDILYEDINSYINKLSYYTYIKGLNSYDGPCNDSFCLIDLNKIKQNKKRRNDENYENIKLNKFTKKKDVLKNPINRKIRNLEKYDQTMGPITENDIIDNLEIIKENLYNFNKTYLNKDYKYIKSNFNRFINNINNSYLTQLKRSLNMVALKFSTILTESSYKNLEDIIFNQYYNIELYINNLSNIIELSKTKLLGKLGNSSGLLASIYNRIDKTIIVFYKVLNEIIQKKIKNINKEEYNSYRKLDNSNVNMTDEIEKSNNEIENRIKPIDYDYSYNNYDNEYDNEFDDNDDDDNYDDEVNYEYKNDDDDNDDTDKEDDDIDEDDDGLIIHTKVKYITIFPNFLFDFSIIPSLNFIININPIFNYKIGVSYIIEKKDDFSLNIDVWGEVEVGIKIEAALSFPPLPKNLRKLLGIPTISVAIGMEGKLISIKVGLKLSLIFNKIKFELDFYTEIKAFTFSFYCLFKFEFTIPFLNIDFGFEFYLFKFEFIGIRLESHITKPYNSLK